MESQLLQYFAGGFISGAVAIIIIVSAYVIGQADQVTRQENSDAKSKDGDD